MPSESNDALSTSNAADIVATPTAVAVNLTPGIRATAPAIINSALPILVSPLPILDQDILPNLSTAPDITCNAAAIIVNPVPVAINLPEPEVNLMNAAISNRAAPMPANPLISPSVFIDAKFSTALANMTNAADNANIPAPLPKLNLAPFIIFINAAISSIATPAAVNPLVNCSTFKSPNFSTASAITINAAANITKAPAVFRMFLDEVSISFVAVHNINIEPAIPANPFAISPHCNPERFLTAADITNNAADIASIAPAIPVILPNAAPLVTAIRPYIAATISANSIVTPTKPFDSSSVSRFDNTNKAAANIPIADAIFSNVPAFKLFWYASNDSLTAVKVSLMFLNAPPKFLNAFPASLNMLSKDSITFLNAPNAPPAKAVFTTPNIALKFIVPIAFPTPPIIAPIPSPKPLTASPILPNTLPQFALAI